MGRVPVNRGEIRWYTFGLPDKRRPVLVLTRNEVIQHLNEIIVVPATRARSDEQANTFMGFTQASAIQTLRISAHALRLSEITFADHDVITALEQSG